MKKIRLLIIALCLALTACAQSKIKANWIFIFASFLAVILGEVTGYRLSWAG